LEEFQKFDRMNFMSDGYTRYRKPGGFRLYVELLESLPTERRQKLIDAGKVEDPEITEKALEYCITTNDILALGDSELMEILESAPPILSGQAFYSLDDTQKRKILMLCKSKTGSQIRDVFDGPEISTPLIGGARLKLIAVARSLEKKTIIKLKQIPVNAPVAPLEARNKK
jgi:flagellar motor switch protein FliG